MTVTGDGKAGLVCVADLRKQHELETQPTWHCCHGCGHGMAARFNFQSGLAINTATTVYVADSGSSTIR